MRRSQGLAIGALLVTVVVAQPIGFAKPKTNSVQILSQTYVIDRRYKSMEGPSALQEVVLGKGGTPELLWLRGIRTEIVKEDGTTPTSKEFMCHINLDYDVRQHATLFGWTKNINDRVFTLSQGEFDVKLPDGFGIPFLSTETLKLGTQVLNHNFDGTYKVRHKVTIDFVRDRDLTTPLKPLFETSAFGMVSLENHEAYYGVNQPTGAQHGASCLPGAHAPNAWQMNVYQDLVGQKFTGHWVVKPGRHTYRTLVTKLMNLPFDTMLHYVAVHVHPFSESLELRDLTSGRVIFTSRMKHFRKGIGIQQVTYFSNVEGVPLYKDHEYELASVYNNTSKTDQDAMATMFLYLLDKEFRAPDLAALRTASTPTGTSNPTAGDRSPAL